MASAVAQAYSGHLGSMPGGVQGQSPWSEDQGTKPLEAECNVKTK